MTVATQPAQRSTPNVLLELLRTLGIFAILLLMVILASIFVPGFATSENFINIFQRSVGLGLVAIGQTFAIVCGSLDLSVAVSISTISVVTAIVMNNQPENIGPAVIVGILIGLGVGLVNGLVITKLRINAFIATLGTSLVLQGILRSFFNNFAGKVPPVFQNLAYSTLFNIPLAVYLFLITAILAYLVLRFTRFGYHVYAVGGNVEVSRLSGVRTDRVIIIAHLLTGLGAALTAIVLIARLRAGGPQVGNGYDLDSISAVVIGGAPLAGGKGGIWGTVAGVLIVSILANVFNFLNVGAYAQDVLRGIVLIVVVAVYSYRRFR